MAADVNYKLGTECNSGMRKVAGSVTVIVDGDELDMAPFVQNIVKNCALAVVSELDGYTEGSRVDIIIE